MTIKVGNDMVLYYNSATDASPTWVEICIVGDVTVDLNIGEAEVDLRCTEWILNLPAKLTGAINFTLANDIGGTVYDALRGYAFGRTQKQMASANGDITDSNTEYFKAFAFFRQFPWAQPTQEMSNHDCQMSLGWTEEAAALVEPSWATVP